MRRLFALAVVVVHGLLLWVLISSIQREDVREAEPVYARLWLNVDPQPQDEPPPASKELQPLANTSAEAAPDPVQETVVPQESPASPAASSDITPAAPGIDWNNEGKLAAKRAAQASGEPKQQGFSPDPKTIRKPCVTRKSSMEWKGEEDRKVTWVGILPVFRLGNCMVTIGAFACSFGKPEANGHLLDDMRSPDRSPSSVPDPNICD